MSINELIQSYPTPNFDAGEFAWSWFIIGTVIVMIFGFLLYLLDRDKSNAIRWSAYLFIVVIFFAFPFGYYNYSTDIMSTSMAKLKWRDEVFTKGYLPSVEEEKVDVISYSVNRDGTVNALLNSDKEKSVGSIGRITYFDSKNPADRGFIKAKYVAGIEEVGIREGYYDVRIHIPNM